MNLSASARAKRKALVSALARQTKLDAREAARLQSAVDAGAKLTANQIALLSVLEDSAAEARESSNDPTEKADWRAVQRSFRQQRMAWPVWNTKPAPAMSTKGKP